MLGSLGGIPLKPNPNHRELTIALRVVLKAEVVCIIKVFDEVVAHVTVVLVRAVDRPIDIP